MNERFYDRSDFCHIKGFVARLIHHFKYGSLPFDSSEELLAANQHIFQFPFDCHPGPMEAALREAETSHISVFLYIYCKENYLTGQANAVLRSDLVRNQISRNFLFLPLDISHPAGWSAAHFLHFRSMPLIALLRPRQGSLEASQVCLKHEGLIGETALLSYLTIVNQGDAAVVAQQDEGFQQAVEEMQENQRSAEELANMNIFIEERRREIEREFESIPLPSDKAESVAIRFRFPDNHDQMRTFYRNGPVRLLFAFVRKFVFPREVVLMTGFPLIRIAENDDLIDSLCSDRQFVVYVEWDEGERAIDP
jgi:hypothetical protein